MWKLRIQSVLAKWLSIHDFSEHIAIMGESDNSEHETFFMVSPHLDTLRSFDSDSSEAYYKSKVLLSILNAALRLDNKHPIIERYLCFQFPDGVINTPHIVNDPVVHLQQLQNPFEHSASIQTAREKGRLGKIISLAHNDDLVREALVLFDLSMPDSMQLYFLINVYKICENIEFDFTHNINIHPKVAQAEQSDMVSALTPFRNGGVVRHYINTRAGSGMQARHGATTKLFTKSAPTFQEVLDLTTTLINTWLDVRISLNER